MSHLRPARAGQGVPHAALVPGIHRGREGVVRVRRRGSSLGACGGQLAATDRVGVVAVIRHGGLAARAWLLGRTGLARAGAAGEVGAGLVGLAGAADEGSLGLGGASGAAGVVVVAVLLELLEGGWLVVWEGGWLLCRPLCRPLFSLEGFGLDALLLHLVLLCCDELGLLCGFGRAHADRVPAGGLGRRRGRL